jgi:hypothetical protein
LGRYIPGRYYRPHIDGAWPPSALDEEGRYVYDGSKGTVLSRYTALVSDGYEEAMVMVMVVMVWGRAVPPHLPPRTHSATSPPPHTHTHMSQ